MSFQPVTVSAALTGEIPVQSHVRFSVKMPKC